MVVYQALFTDGDIVETDSFKNLFVHAMHHCRINLHWDSSLDVEVCRFCIAEYSDDEYLNRYGYYQHELLNRQELAIMAVSRNGFTIEYNSGVYEFTREGKEV